MDKQTYDKGAKIRSEVLGADYVAEATRNVDAFNKPLQDLVTEYCWGAVWGRDDLPLKTRSMLNLAMISALNRPHELKTHIRAALTNGVTREEIREVFLQVAIYAGVPAAVDSFRLAREVITDLDSQQGRQP
ncbi:carboxymuconolactone decarboxylase family protein [Mycolicibacterium boenickei]